MTNQNKNRNNKNNKNKKETVSSTLNQQQDGHRSAASAKTATNTNLSTKPDTLSASGMCTRAREAGKRNIDNRDIDSSSSSLEGVSSPSKKQAKTDSMDKEHQDDILANASTDNLSKKGDPNDDRWTWLMNKLNSIENNTSTISQDVAKLTSTVEGHAKQIQETKSAVASQNRKIDEVSKEQDSLLARVDDAIGEQLESFKISMKKDNELFRAELINLANKKVDKKVAEALSDVREEVMESKTEARNRNLIIVGLPEGEDEESDIKAAKDLFKSRMGLPKINLDQIVRLGKQEGLPPRPALVTFHYLSHRNRVWYAKSKLKQVSDSENDQSQKIWLQEDVPKPMKVAQKALYQTFKRARSMKDTYKSVQLKGTKLIIDGTAYSHNDMNNLPPPLRPASLATLRSDSVIIFFGRASPLSNHHHSPFLLEGHHFACVEQFLAWKRAELAGDVALSTKALSSPNPTICKGILNDLHQADSTAWDEQVDGIIEAALTAKFTQNQNLGSFLLDTRPCTLGEASLNAKWGIGLKLTNKNAMDPAKWKENGNLLGNKLMKIREELFLKHHAN